jgi:LuxR family transcriptional regulator
MFRLQNLKSQIEPIATAGFYLALRIGFAFPEAELNGLGESWVDHYIQHGLVRADPAIRWAYEQTGAARLSEMNMPDPEKVLPRALFYGLSFGAVVSVLGAAAGGRRSFGIFFRQDREFAAAELTQLHDIVKAAHLDCGNRISLTQAEREALCLQGQGLRLRQVAQNLGISESAVKGRLNNAKRKLGAKTIVQALSIAQAQRLI